MQSHLGQRRAFLLYHPYCFTIVACVKRYLLIVSMVESPPKSIKPGDKASPMRLSLLVPTKAVSKSKRLGSDFRRGEYLLCGGDEMEYFLAWRHGSKRKSFKTELEPKLAMRVEWSGSLCRTSNTDRTKYKQRFLPS